MYTTLNDTIRSYQETRRAERLQPFRYDLARWNGPRLILVTDDSPSKRSSIPLLGTVVLPSATQDERVWR